MNTVAVLMDLLIPSEDERIQIPGEIMNCHQQLQELSLGIKFELAERKTALMLQRFIAAPSDSQLRQGQSISSDLVVLSSQIRR